VHFELEDVPPAELLLLALPGVDVSVLEALPPPEEPLLPALPPEALPPEELSPADDPPALPPLAPALLPPLLLPPALPPPAPPAPPPCAQDALARPNIAAVIAALISFNFITGIPLGWVGRTAPRLTQEQCLAGGLLEGLERPSLRA
jgi:hypothetical protein